jgi:hypothetical protein
VLADRTTKTGIFVLRCRDYRQEFDSYDLQHLVIYLRLLDAKADGAD